MDIVEKLQKLTPEDLEKLGQFIDRLANKKEKPKNKPKRRRKRKDINNAAVQSNSEEQYIKPEPVQKIKAEKIGPSNKLRRSNRKRHDEPREQRRGQGKAKVFAAPQPVNLGPRPNIFFQMKDKSGRKVADAHKEDVEIDKKLAKNPPVPRIRGEVNFAILTCMECGYDWKVPEALIPPEPDRFKCNDCAGGR